MTCRGGKFTAPFLDLATVIRYSIAMTNIALTYGSERDKNIKDVLNLIKKDIEAGVSKLDPQTQSILIKPNFVVINTQLAATHVKAVTAVLDFLTKELNWTGRIIIAEGSGVGETFDGFKNYGYLDLPDKYPNLELKDLNYDDYVKVEIFDETLNPMKITLSKTVVESPYRISIGPPKTHDSMVMTASIKNMAVGAILKKDKWNFHQGPKATNLSLAKINQYTQPHLSIIDGFEAMEGNGPADGERVNWQIALASTDALAADTTICYLMGIDVSDVGYLTHLGGSTYNVSKYKIIDESLEKHKKKFRLHETINEQLQWRQP